MPSDRHLPGRHMVTVSNLLDPDRALAAYPQLSKDEWLSAEKLVSSGGGDEFWLNQSWVEHQQDQS